MNIYLAQINPRVGDFKYNFALIQKTIEQNSDASFIIFPELSVCGYSPQDLSLRKDFQLLCDEYTNKILKLSIDYNGVIIVGSIRTNNDKIYNSAFVMHQGRIISIYDKLSLPNHGVFDEKRIFAPGAQISLIELNGRKFSVIICEDMWSPGVREELLNLMPDYIFCLNASPYTKTKEVHRRNIAINLAKESNAYVIYVNQVGLQDSVLYDGASFALSPEGDVIYQAPKFVESLGYFNISNNTTSKNVAPHNIIQDIYKGLVFALQDYIAKSNMQEVIIGFSSGIDSSLTAILAFDAIGSDKVHLYGIPTSNNSQDTLNDAEEFCIKNHTNMQIIDIDKLYDSFAALIKLTEEDEIATQNLQSRIRGTILMGLSNQKKYLLLSTGNKSELAVGYSTLYGDMNGGYNLLKDVYKTEVYQLAKWRNNNIPTFSQHKISAPIPDNIITKEPSAELAQGQKDSDTLPPYDILDKILQYYIEDSKSCEQIKNLGFDAEMVDYIANLVRIGQFKRYQSTMGPKISDMSFDLDWRYPIMNFFDTKI